MINLSQFLKNSNQKKKSYWWIIGFAVLGLLLVLGQTLYAPNENLAAPQAQSTVAVSETGTDTEAQGFLPDYNPTDPALATPQTDERPFWQMALDMGVKLLLVIGMIYGMLIALKWLQKIKNPIADGTATIQVLETVGLSPGRTLHLVVVGEKTLLLGSTENNINTLAELSDTDAPVTETLIADEKTDIAPSDFEFQLKVEDSKQVSSLAKETADTMEWSDTLQKMRSGVQNFRHVVGGSTE